VPGDADADAAADLLTAEQDGFDRDPAEFLGHRGRMGFVGAVLHHQHEFVAAEPGHQVTVGRGAQPVGQGGQVLVPADMAQDAVQRLQPVDVQEDERDRSGFAEQHPPGEVVDQRPPVRQPGEFVVVGHGAEPILSGNSGLDLGQQGGDGPQGGDFGVLPCPVAELDEPQHAHGAVDAQQRDGHRGDATRES
jgi:hypothetical protein